MKRFILLFAVFCTMTCGFAQSRSNTNTAKEVKEVREMIDSLADAHDVQREAVYAFMEETMIAVVDSLVETGMYMNALDLLDSIQVNWKYITGSEPSPRMYISKGNILNHLEEWGELVKTTEECLSIHKEDITDRIAALMYSMQGSAYRNLKVYQKAIRSYEEGAYYYTKIEDSGSQGDMLCSMAACYAKIGKYTMAFSFYEKGFNKFLEYFGTTRSYLLRNDLYVSDVYKKAVLGVFGAHLFGMAVFEQDYGSRLESQEYLLMAAHCGNAGAKSEYQRIYGNK